MAVHKVRLHKLCSLIDSYGACRSYSHGDQLHAISACEKGVQWLLNEMRDEGLSSPYPHAVCYRKTATDMSLMMMMVMVMMMLMMINTTLQNQDDKKHQKTQNNKFENAKSAE